MSKISKNIKKLRSLNGMTQEALAIKLHVTRQTVSSWETDRTQPDLQLLQALAEAFGVEVEELIYGKRKNAAEEKEKLLFGNTLVTVLSVLGCLLIGTGVVMIFVKFWQDFPDALKIFTCFVPALLGQGIGIYTYIRKKDSIPWCEGASVLWMLGAVVTTTILLNGADLDYHIITDRWMFLSYAIGAFVLMTVFKTLSPLAVFHACSILWFGTLLGDSRLSYISGDDSLQDILKFIAVVAVESLVIAAAFYASEKLYKKESNIIRYTFASWVNFIALAVFIGYTVMMTPLGEAFISLIILAAIICFIIGQKHTDFVSPYRMLGLPVTAAALCFLGVIFSPGYVSEDWVNAFMIGICLVPLIFLLWERTRPKSVYLRAYGILITLALAAYNIIVYLEESLNSEDYVNGTFEKYNVIEKGFFSLNFFLCLAALIILIIYGAKERKLLYLNLGFVLSCVSVIAKLYLLDMGLIVTGILLIACGATLLFINLKISKLREKEKLASFKTEEEGLQ